LCTLGANEEDGYCPAMRAEGIDGLAFGAKWVVDDGSTQNYCVGFHEPKRTDSWVCMKFGNDLPTSYYCADSYSVTPEYFTTSGT